MKVTFKQLRTSARIFDKTDDAFTRRYLAAYSTEHQFFCGFMDLLGITEVETGDYMSRPLFPDAFVYYRVRAIPALQSLLI